MSFLLGLLGSLFSLLSKIKSNVLSSLKLAHWRVGMDEETTGLLLQCTVWRISIDLWLSSLCSLIFTSHRNHKCIKAKRTSGMLIIAFILANLKLQLSECHVFPAQLGASDFLPVRPCHKEMFVLACPSAGQSTATRHRLTRLTTACKYLTAQNRICNGQVCAAHPVFTTKMVIPPDLDSFWFFFELLSPKPKRLNSETYRKKLNPAVFVSVLACSADGWFDIAEARFDLPTERLRASKRSCWSLCSRPLFLTVNWMSSHKAVRCALEAWDQKNVRKDSRCRCQEVWKFERFRKFRILIFRKTKELKVLQKLI